MSTASIIPDKAAEVEFFISYTGADKGWAEWIAWQLEEAGHKTIIQAWDFKSGGVFPGDMHRALQQSARVIAVLTPDYMASGFCQPEWQSAFADDPTGEKGILVCVRVTDFKPDGILRGRTYIDLVGKDAATAASFLLERLKQDRAKPATAPAHPPTLAKSATPPPAFPGNPSAPTPSIPNNLPRLDAFFGREKELSAIATDLDPKSRTWGTLIDGDGGIGKTSLAIRAACNVSPSHFKRIIFFSLKEHELYDDGVRSRGGLALSCWIEILDEMARKLDRTEITKAPDLERSRLLNDALRDQHVLLVLDNLESLSKDEQSQLFEFLNVLPNDCKAILTSREFFGNKVHALKLLELDQPHAMELLKEIAKHNRPFAKSSEVERVALYKQTNGNPLLLRWVAGQVGTGHCTSLADALEHLRSCPEGNNALEFVFGHLLTTLAPADIKILAALSFPSQPIPIKAIAEISGVATDYVRKHLKVLTNRSLVVPYEDEKEYSLVPMVGDFLSQARHEVMKQTGSRLEDRAFALITENGGKKHDRFPVLEAAWPGIAPAMPLFLAGDNARLQTVCDSLSDFLHFQGRWDEQLALSEKAESRSVVAADYDMAGWRAYDVGYVHRLRQQAHAVLACADRAAEHWERAQAGARERAIASQLRGIGHQLKEDYPAAITAYREVLDLHRSLAAENENEDVAISLNDLASAEQLSGDFTTAELHYSEALRMARAVGSAEIVAGQTGNLAGLALARKDWSAAEALAREALPLAEKVGRQELIASNNRRIAQALVRQGKAAEALPYAQKAVEIYTRLGSPDLAAAQAILNECETAV